MRLIILAAGAALTLTACNSGNDAQNADDGTDLQVGNLIINDTGDMNAAGPVDMNATDMNTQNAMMNDLTNNDADTNLANGT